MVFSNFSFFVCVTKISYKGDLRRESFNLGHCFRAETTMTRGMGWLPTLCPQSGSRDVSSTLILNLLPPDLVQDPSPWYAAAHFQGESSQLITPFWKLLADNRYSQRFWLLHGSQSHQIDKITEIFWWNWTYLLNCFKGHFDFAPF